MIVAYFTVTCLYRVTQVYSEEVIIYPMLRTLMVNGITTMIALVR